MNAPEICYAPPIAIRFANFVAIDVTPQIPVIQALKLKDEHASSSHNES